MGFEGRAQDGADRRPETAVALVMGNLHTEPPLVRIHSQCLTGDVFGSLRCDCRQQLEMSLKMIAEADVGCWCMNSRKGAALG